MLCSSSCISWDGKVIVGLKYVLELIFIGLNLDQVDWFC